MAKFKEFMSTARPVTRWEEIRLFIIGAFSGAILTIIVLATGFMR